MFDHLQITNRYERGLVGLADLALRLVPVAPRAAGAAATAPPARILLLRLERIGDLVMTLDAFRRLRATAPGARIDLVVGSWNAPLAALVPEVDRFETLDVPWMTRSTTGVSWSGLVRRAVAWRAQRYDLAINFEGDVRSHVLLALSGAPRRVGFPHAGGGPLLTDVVPFDPAAHVAVNADRLVRHAADDWGGGRRPPAAGDGPEPSPRPRLLVPPDARRRADALLRRAGARRTLIGVQPGAGRAIKEWVPSRLAAVATALTAEGDVSIVVCGGPSDRHAVAAFEAALPDRVHRVRLPAALELVGLAGVLSRLALFITPDSGPMHLAAAVGTPIVAIFGPSLPSRYAPLVDAARLVRVDLPCSPCNRLRQPPAWCVGHVPDCLTGIETDQVIDAARDLLARAPR